MKKILVTVVLGLAVAATGQVPAQPPAQQPQAQPPAPGQPAGSQAPVIKDPAEYNAYVGAVQQTDPQAKISGLEAFITQYPNSVMKNQALEILMGAYQQAGNQQKDAGGKEGFGIRSVAARNRYGDQRSGCETATNCEPPGCFWAPRDRYFCGAVLDQ